MEDKTTKQITAEFSQEFAELSLEIVKYMRERKDYDCELIREVRENAQALFKLVNSL